jgi:hypothetical protein
MSTQSPETPRCLRSDERGAIMLIALAFAVFGVAMLYYAVGIAQTILLREKLQDAADATALSSAVVQARSMNFLVLLNIIMAALIAILVAFKLVETLAIIGIIIAAALAWVTGGSTLSAVPPLKVVQQEMRSLYDTTKEPIFTALEVLHDTADVVAKVAPGAAQDVAEADLAEFWQPEVQETGVVYMRESALPVEDDTFDHLCERGGKLAGDLAMKPLPLPGAIKDPVKDALGSLTGGMSDWFCGDSGGPPPNPPPQSVKKRFPRTNEMEECQHEVLSAQELAQAAQDPEAFHTPACDESTADADAAEPDDHTGECRTGADCSESGPYETHAKLAREQCEPTTFPGPYSYTYQVQTGRVLYTFDKKLGWIRGEPELDAPGLVKASRPPCGPKSVQPTVAVGYEKIVRAKRGGELQPLCSNELPPVLPAVGPSAPTSITVEFTNVNHMLTCEKWVKEPVQVGDADSSGDSGDGKLPKRVNGDVTLGGEAFQTRVFVKTAQDASSAASVVKLSLWGAQSPEAELPVGHELRQFGFAQAEYFYDGTDERAEWMWNMKWRARLRRFRLPEDVVVRSDLWGKCQINFGEVGKMRTAMAQVEAEIAH